MVTQWYLCIQTSKNRRGTTKIPGSSVVAHAVKRQKLADLCEFEASPVYRVNSRLAKLYRESLS